MMEKNVNGSTFAINGICFLSNPVREYAWGSATAIADLLGSESPSDRPQAELWMGAHPVAPSIALAGNDVIPLDKWIAESPEGLLGKQTALKFGNRLPYLMKVLAARTPLSLQVHPDRDLARQGFDRENRLGIPLNAPHRTYRDDHHKPELLCALSPFHLLNGFRSPEQIRAFFHDLSGGPASALLECLEQPSEARALELFFRRLMTLLKSERMDVIEAAVARTCMGNEGSAEYDWIRKLHEEYPGDIGVLSPLFLNLIRLEPGRAVFLEPGTPHTYLEGVGVEVMADSDNVLRGGLTPKHVDVPELIRASRFASRPSETILPIETRAGEFSYPAPVEEFILSMIRFTPGSIYVSPDVHSLDILLCIEGKGILTCEPDQRLEISRGRAVMIPAHAGTYRLSGNGVVYKTSVPVNGE